MPLIKSASKEAFSGNVAEMRDAGHPRAQALAAAYSVMRKAKRRADGGDVSDAPTSPNYEQANKDLQLNPQEQALYQRHLTNLTGSGGVDNPDGSRSTLYQSVQEHNGKYYNIPTVWSGSRETQPYVTPDGRVMDVPNQTALDNVEKEGWEKFPSYSTPDEADARYNQMHGYMEQDTSDYFASKKRASGGTVRNPAVTRALAVARRAKGGKVHVGPIKGDEGGRTDVHEMAVPDGAYVLPADFISHLGESNSQAGLKKAQELFGDPPKRNAGGKVKPVDCITAGGEFVISPAKVKEIGKGDLEFGHKILDQLVLRMRQDHIKTLKGLPKPATD